MSRFFRRPDDSDSSSTESSSEPGPEESASAEPRRLRETSSHRDRQPPTRHHNPSAEDDSETSNVPDVDRSDAQSNRSARSDTLSADASISRHTSSQHVARQANINARQHQGMLLATLLEEYYRTRAAEFLNTTKPGHDYTRHSPEVQQLAQRLFAQASTRLESEGIDVPTSSEDTRAQYLAGLDQLGAGASATNLLTAMRHLNVQSHLSTDQQLTTYVPARPKSHYQNSFREVCLLGKGGFGRVFKCHNLLDQKTYAVKKIPLSPQLSKSFAEGRHEELQHVLIEVQTLASLDHANIVRYHATWVEEPQATSPTAEMSGMARQLAQDRQLPRRRALLLESAANSRADLTFSMEQAQPVSCGFVFAEDSHSGPASGGAHDAQGPLRQEDFEPSALEDTASEETSANESDIFTNGTRSNLPLVERQQRHDQEPSHTHELYIQMSLYPMTLHHYLSSSETHHPRHCYHLLPSLRILLAILSGLRYLWSRRLVHRDIKPRNIFLSEPEEQPLTGYCNASCRHACHGHRPRYLNPRIGDFGLVTQLAHGELPELAGGRANRVVGTPLYRPPACAWDSTGTDTEKVDVFALGVVFVELLCPFSTAMERADALGSHGLQKGVLPECFRARLEKEGVEESIIAQVVEMTEGMVHLDPEMRWSGERITEVGEGILKFVSPPERGTRNSA